MSNPAPFITYPQFFNQARVMMFGDSVPQASSRTASNLQFISSRGWINWINALTGFKFIYNDTLNKGVSGDTTTASLARWGTDVAPNLNNFDILWIHVGTNDPSNAIPPATSIANIQTMITRARNAGKLVIVDTILPRGSPNAYTATQALQAAVINQGIRAMGVENTNANVLVFDPWRDIADPANGGQPFANSTLDGVHPNMSLANAMGNRFVQQASPLFAPSSIWTQSQWDTYDATNNPKGNMIVNPGMTGTGGTFTGTAVGGALATGYNLLQASGTAGAGTVVCSKTAAVAGYGCAGTDKQNIVFNIPSANTATETFQLRCDQTTAGLTAASGSGSFYAQCEFDISGVVGLYWLDLECANYDGAATQYTLFNEQDGYGTPQSLVAGHYTFRTQAVPITYASTPFIRFIMNFGFNCSANVGQMTIGITNAFLRMA